ncbi:MULTISPECIES: putative beta-lysine N-acetyltransferase [Cytobacillus]|uniref:putative beta-lysine N-acetyltransferase n=1 Tax=Cytobacillus TaxID=2675230 RepID=UPI00203A4B55|nr:putative beta-lysine N-acetyltransferase [Cytobacillus firmus]MCM3706367.1 putative beta-lysine N-acetyltransferase [Cytobacillus firmus]URM32698.1 putative beta-lysine N-acetyltransferase [Cytobacillus firmus]
MNICLGNKFEVDKYNDRIVSYIVKADESSVKHISSLEKEYYPSKVIVYTLPEHAGRFRENGYIMEGKISGFFHGKDGQIFAKYPKSTRKESSAFDENQGILKAAVSDSKEISKVILKEDFEMIEVTEKDADELAALYKKVFKYYPTDVHDPDYLKQVMGKDYFFTAIRHNGKIVSAASAMVMEEFNCAEVTDCATDPDFRGNRLIYSIILELEKRLKENGVQTLFSLTRAQSHGMNLTVKRLGYQYEGTLVNNCVISSGYEDMNIWTKSF